MAGLETRNHSSLPRFTMRCLLILMVVSTMFVESLPITAKSDAIIAAIKAKIQSVKQVNKSSGTSSTAVNKHYYFYERKFKKYFRKGKKGRKVQKHHIAVNRH